VLVELQALLELLLLHGEKLAIGWNAIALVPHLLTILSRTIATSVSDELRVIVRASKV